MLAPLTETAEQRAEREAKKEAAAAAAAAAKAEAEAEAAERAEELRVSVLYAEVLDKYVSDDGSRCACGHCDGCGKYNQYFNVSQPLQRFNLRCT